MACPGAFGGGHGSPLPPAPARSTTSAAAPSTVAVLLDAFDRILSSNAGSLTVVAQAGVRIDRLLAWAEAHSMSMERGAPVSFGELTLGGVLSTGGHGTGAGVPSSLADVTLNITWVDARGVVHTSERNSTEGRALAGGVGMIGIIAEVGLQMTPPSITQAHSRVLVDDNNLAEDIRGYLQATPNTAIIWRPDLGRYSAFLMSPASGPSEGDAWGVLAPMPAALTTTLELLTRPWQADTSSSGWSKVLDPLNCLTQAATMAYQTWASRGVLPQLVGVGSTNKIMVGGCSPSCPWNNGLSLDDIAFAFDLSQLPDWISDVRRIMLLDLKEGGWAPQRCMPTGHILLRFGKSTDDFGAMVSGLLSPVIAELSLLRSQQLPHTPAKYSWIQEVIEQLTRCKYKGRPHWGKNFDRTYTNPACPLRDSLPNFQQLLDMQAKHDPSKVFEAPLMSKVINRQPHDHFPGCAVSKQCYCRDDTACGPGFECVLSAAFPEYRVCKPSRPRWLG